MTEFDKAKELVSRFSVTSVKMSDDSHIEFPTAKTHAIICVDEMIKMLPFTDLNTYIGRWCEQQRQYLEDVKQEIEKL
jgi:hypothetical protein